MKRNWTVQCTTVGREVLAVQVALLAARNASTNVGALHPAERATSNCERRITRSSETVNGVRLREN